MSTNDPNAPGQPPVPQPPAEPSGQQPLMRPAQPVTVPPAQSSWQIPSARQRFGPVGILLVILVLYALFRPHSQLNPNEQLATRVTLAIVGNDMLPVEGLFEEKLRPRLEDRMLVGRLSQDLNDLGKFKAVKEDTPQGVAAGKHHFEATFEKGTWVEDMTIDKDGKIAAFHVHAPETK